MFESALVYLGLVLVMTFLAWFAGQAKNYKWFWLVLCSLSYAVVMGIRMNVGVDFPMYYKVYQQVQSGGTGGFGMEHFEPGFQLIYLIFGSQHIHYSIPFGFISFIQMFLIFVGLRKYPQVWVLIPMTFFFTGCFVNYNNVTRHMIALSIFICAIPFLAERKYWKYLGCIILASLFHKSALALVLIPPVYMFCKEVFTRIWVQLAWLAFGLVMMNIDVVQNVFEALSMAILFLGYNDYLHTSFADFNENKKIGLGFVFMFAACVILILNSRKMKEFYKSRTVNIMYDMFFFGYIIRLAFVRMFLLQRFNYYFINFEFIIGAFTLYMFIRKKQWVWFAALMVLYTALFFARLNVKEDGSVLYHTFLEYQ